MQKTKLKTGFDLGLYHVDHAIAVQKKIQLDLEHQARKSRLPTTKSQAPPASRQHRSRSEDVEVVAVEHITLDDMFVIDSAGEYSVSGDENEVPAADGDRTSKRDAVSADAHRRKDFQLFLSYLRSVDCNFQEAVRTYFVDPDKVSQSQVSPRYLVREKKQISSVGDRVHKLYNA